MPLKVTHLNHSDISGGAARAAYRIHRALRSVGVDSTMSVIKEFAGDWTVNGPQGKWNKLSGLIRPHLADLMLKAMRTGNQNMHSLAVFNSNLVNQINSSDADVVNLHWVCYEMLSVRDISRIRKPLVWTLHDMWAFCGAEHYTEDFRWRDGYKNNRPEYESGFDLNRRTWLRKKKYWQKPIHIIAPSQWLANCVSESDLMSEWPVHVIPNCLDMEQWQPVEQAFARKLFNLPQDKRLLLFGAMSGGRDPRKGFDLLLEALSNLRGTVDDLELIVFGQLEPKEMPDLGFPIHYTGHLGDDLSLRTLYSAADVLAVPSRQDNLPNTAVEAQACGTPVVSFDIGGLPDIVTHKKTGYLAKKFDSNDFAEGIRWILDNSDKEKSDLSREALHKAVKLYSDKNVAAQYKAVYEKIAL